MAAKCDDLAGEAAEAIARLENKRALRQQTAAKLETRAMRLQSSVEAVNRRLLDLRQGAITAKAARQDSRMHKQLNTTLSGQDPMSEAEELIRSVLGEDDPFEQAEILGEIDAGLEGVDLAGKLAESGFGAVEKTRKASVLERLKSKK